MRLMAAMAGCLAVLWLTPGAIGADEWRGVVRARHDLELSLTVGGLVKEVLVAPGDTVGGGAPLVRLDDDAARSQVELLRFRAEGGLDVESAQAKLDMARVEEQIVKDLRAEGSAGAFEVQKAELRTKLAEIERRIAEHAQQELARQIQRGERELTRYELRSPLAGVVEQVEVSVGESVEALQVVVRIVVTDPLRVEVFVPTARTLGLERGDGAWVRMEMEGSAGGWRRGEVAHVAAVADAGSEMRRVWVDVANPQGLPAGMNAMVRLTEPAAGLGRGGVELRDDAVVGAGNLRLGHAQDEGDLRRREPFGVPQDHEEAVLQREVAHDGVADALRGLGERWFSLRRRDGAVAARVVSHGPSP